MAKLNLKKASWSTFVRFSANFLALIAAKQKKFPFKARPCYSKEDLIDGYALNYKRYLKKQYCLPNQSKLFFNKFAFSPSALSFFLDYQDQIAGTITLYEDSNIGLPIESLHPTKINRFRKAGLKIAEVGGLSLDTQLLGCSGKNSLTNLTRLSALFLLFKAMHNYAYYRELTHLVIMVHPRHENLYRLFDFRQFAPIKPYAGAQGSAALPLIQDIRASVNSAKDKGLKKFFYSPSFSSEFYSKTYRWTESDLLKFAQECPDAIQAVHDYLEDRKLVDKFGRSISNLGLRETFLA